MPLILAAAAKPRAVRSARKFLPMGEDKVEWNSLQGAELLFLGTRAQSVTRQRIGSLVFESHFYPYGS